MVNNVAVSKLLGYGPRMSTDTKYPGADGANETTHFGFEEVSPREKTARVTSVFSSVASRYDLMNDLMSAGIHRLWKAALVDRLNPRNGMRLVDVGGGTGDIAFRVLDRADADITICDRNPDMLSEGRDRALDRGRLNDLRWVCGDAECLPLPDGSVDAYVAAFSLRNVTRLDAALADARRLLAPGGRFLCLEFSHIAIPALEVAYDAYSFNILPALGQWVADDRDSYRYLAESIRQFPNQDAFAAQITAAGLEQVRYHNMSGGIVALHSAWRI